jgi:outer membrane murein-binding lipoprotein Lpp
MRIAMVVLASVLVVGCSHEPRVESSTTDAVTVSYFEGQQSSADAKAREECSKYGKRARFRNTSSSSTGDRFGIYECLPP